MTALDPVVVAGDHDPTVDLIIELQVGTRVARFDVREFTPYCLVVEIRGATGSTGSTGTAGWMAATLEILDETSGSRTRERFACEIEFAGWQAVSGNLDGPKLSAARLRLDGGPELRAELARLYRQRLSPSVFDPRELPSVLGVDAIHRARDGELLGRVRVIRAYSQTWMVDRLELFDVAEDHVERDACQAALFQQFAIAPILLDGHQQQWLVHYFDRRDCLHAPPGLNSSGDSSGGWNSLFFDQFVDWFDERRKAAMIRFDRFGLSNSNSGSRSDSPNPIELDQVQPAELDRVVALIRSQLPEIACAAFDIEAARLDRVYLHPDYAAHGIVRGRRVFVAREASELVGVALCETGSLSGESAQLYFRAGASIHAKRALIEFVRKHYGALGRSCPDLLAPVGSLAEPERLGLTQPSPIGCMIWSGATLRAYRTFLRSAFARIVDSPRKRRRHAAAGPRSIALDPAESLRSAEVRARLQTDIRLAPLLSAHQRPSELLGFLLHFCALGVRMAERSERELERGRLLLDDLFDLGQAWREQLGVRINVELLLLQPPPRSLLRWTELSSLRGRGGLRAGTVSLAIDLELAQFWAQIGPTLLERLGQSRTNGTATRWLTLVSADTTSAWFAKVAAQLAAEPEHAPAITRVRNAALEAYLDVVGDCVALGRELAERVRVHRAVGSAVGSAGGSAETAAASI